MSAHTPGPWMRTHSHPDAASRASIAYIESAARRAPLEIATVYGCNSDAEQRANANLIAAAPELFEALDEMLREFGVDGHGTEFEDGECMVVDRARAALARAEGGAK